MKTTPAKNPKHPAREYELAIGKIAPIIVVLYLCVSN